MVSRSDNRPWTHTMVFATNETSDLLAICTALAFLTFQPLGASQSSPSLASIAPQAQVRAVLPFEQGQIIVLLNEIIQSRDNASRRS